MELIDVSTGSRLAAVLLHFLWEGAAIGLMAVVLLRLTCSSSPGVRYSMAVSSLWLMILAPAVTWNFVTIPEQTDLQADSIAPWKASERRSRAFDQNGLEYDDAIAPMPIDIDSITPAEQPAQSVLSLNSFSSETALDLSDNLASTSPEPIASRRHLDGLSVTVLAVWGIGVGFLMTRLLIGYFWGVRMAASRLPLEPGLQSRVDQFTMRLNWRGTLRVCAHAKLTEAIVVGYLKPVVLLPISWTTNLPGDVVEAVIVHELTHIRRFDLWIILLQRLTETVLFYHPAVWWLSRRISEEREYCCDAEAAGLLGSPLEYAASLHQVAEFLYDKTRLPPQPAPAWQSLFSPTFGGQKMELLSRVQSVLNLSVNKNEPPLIRRSYSNALTTFAIPLMLTLIGWSIVVAGGNEAARETSADHMLTTPEAQVAQAPSEVDSEAQQAPIEQQPDEAVLEDKDPASELTKDDSKITSQKAKDQTQAGTTFHTPFPFQLLTKSSSAEWEGTEEDDDLVSLIAKEGMFKTDGIVMTFGELKVTRERGRYRILSTNADLFCHTADMDFRLKAKSIELVVLEKQVTPSRLRAWGDAKWEFLSELRQVDELDEPVQSLAKDVPKINSPEDFQKYRSSRLSASKTRSFQTAKLSPKLIVADIPEGQFYLYKTRGVLFGVEGIEVSNATFDQSKCKFYNVDGHLTDQEISQRLDQVVAIDETISDLGDALNSVATQSQVDILLDEAVVKNSLIELDAPVSMVSSGISVRSTLKLLLEKFPLTYRVEDGAVWIVYQDKPVEKPLDVLNWGTELPPEFRNNPELLHAEIEKRLRQNITLENTVRLIDAIQVIQKKTKVGFLFDNVEMHQLGVDEESPLTVRSGEGQISTVLKVILGPLGLGYVIEDGVVKITSQEAVNYKKIKQALQQPMSIHVIDKPIADLLGDIANDTHVNIVILEQGLAQEELTPQTLVSINAVQVPCKTVLEFVLRPLGLTHRIENEVVTIDSRSGRGRLVTKVYEVEDLLRGAEDPKTDVKRVENLIRSHVAPNNWNHAGGDGALVLDERSLSLVIRHTEESHQEIEELLELFRDRMRSGKPGMPELGELSKKTQIINARLEQIGSVDVKDNQLYSFINRISDMAGVPTFIDGKGLRECGYKDSTVPVTLRAENVSYKTMLEQALTPLGISFGVVNDVLLISSAPRCRQPRETFVYKLDSKVLEEMDVEQIAEQLQQQIVPDTWSKTGGWGVVTTEKQTGSLVITHSTDFVPQILEFLKSLGDQASDTKSAE